MLALGDERRDQDRDNGKDQQDCHQEQRGEQVIPRSAGFGIFINGALTVFVPPVCPRVAPGLRRLVTTYRKTGISLQVQRLRGRDPVSHCHSPKAASWIEASGVRS